MAPLKLNIWNVDLLRFKMPAKLGYAKCLIFMLGSAICGFSGWLPMNGLDTPRLFIRVKIFWIILSVLSPIRFERHCWYRVFCSRLQSTQVWWTLPKIKTSRSVPRVRQLPGSLLDLPEFWIIGLNVWKRLDWFCSLALSRPNLLINPWYAAWSLSAIHLLCRPTFQLNINFSDLFSSQYIFCFICQVNGRVRNHWDVVKARMRSLFIHFAKPILLLYYLKRLRPSDALIFYRLEGLVNLILAWLCVDFLSLLNSKQRSVTFVLIAKST